MIALVGHSTLRVATISDLNKKASTRELDAMLKTARGCPGCRGCRDSAAVCFILREELRTWRNWSPWQDLQGRSWEFYTAHLRDEYDYVLDALQEAVETASQGQVPLIVSHHKCAGMQNWGRTTETLVLLDGSRKRHSPLISTVILIPLVPACLTRNWWMAG